MLYIDHRTFAAMEARASFAGYDDDTLPSFVITERGDPSFVRTVCAVRRLTGMDLRNSTHLVRTWRRWAAR